MFHVSYAPACYTRWISFIPIPGPVFSLGLGCLVFFISLLRVICVRRLTFACGLHDLYILWDTFCMLATLHLFYRLHLSDMFYNISVMLDVLYVYASYGLYSLYVLLCSTIHIFLVFTSLTFSGLFHMYCAFYTFYTFSMFFVYGFYVLYAGISVFMIDMMHMFSTILHV